MKSSDEGVPPKSAIVVTVLWSTPRYSDVFYAEDAAFLPLTRSRRCIGALLYSVWKPQCQKRFVARRKECADAAGRQDECAVSVVVFFTRHTPAHVMIAMRTYTTNARACQS